MTTMEQTREMDRKEFMYELYGSGDEEEEEEEESNALGKWTPRNDAPKGLNMLWKLMTTPSRETRK
jgi:hypothetical protein